VASCLENPLDLSLRIE